MRVRRGRLRPRRAPVRRSRACRAAARPGGCRRRRRCDGPTAEAAAVAIRRFLLDAGTTRLANECWPEVTSRVVLVPYRLFGTSGVTVWVAPISEEFLVRPGSIPKSINFSNVVWPNFSPTTPGRLIELVAESVVGVGPGRSLSSMLAAVEAYYDANDIEAACAQLDGVQGHVRGLKRARRLDSATADQLLLDVASIRKSIGCLQ